MIELLTFLNRSYSRYHAVANLEQELRADGYTRLWENRDWTLESGGKYYVIRNGSALIAFRIPAEAPPTGFMLSASHSDSPTFKIKENAELDSPDGYVRLNISRYGGVFLGSWLDRPLSVAGRVLVRQENGSLQPRLIYIDKDLLLIPNVAKHVLRDTSTSYQYDMKDDLFPLMGLSGSQGAFRREVSAAADCAPDDILGSDLCLCIRQEGIRWGANREFISSPRLDDLQCAYGCFRGFLAAEPSPACPVYVLLDNEEVGSLTRQGAHGTFLSSTLHRICRFENQDFDRMVSNSFLVSADNAHAVHPNHPEYADPTHRPRMNGGIVVKCGVRYATDGMAQAVFAALCDRVHVPLQYFSNRSDLKGGSTLGNIANAHVSLPTVDIGLAQLAMHSCFETAGAEDTDYLIQAMTAFYSAAYQEDSDGISIA